MNNDLIERYIYAVTKRMNRKQRDDVAQELRTLVDDMLTERCADRLPEEKDIRVVLTELGTPQELYSQYAEDAGKCLIGQPYYSTYKFVMKVVLLSVAGGLTVANLILQMIEPKSFFNALLLWAGHVRGGLLESFAIVTLLFVYFYRKGIKLTEPFNFDDLPPVPNRSQEISKWESIAGIGFSILFAVLFLFTPQVFCAIYDGVTISLFDTNVIQDTWWLIVAFTACGIGREVVQLMEGRYNKKVLTTALVTDAASAVLCIWWLKGFDVMNPELLANMQAILSGESEIVSRMFANFDTFFLGVMLLALLLDAVDVTVRTLRK